MKIRAITEEDLPGLVDLLVEGFPSKTAGYWRHALDVLSHRPAVGDLPRFGLTLEHDGALQGVMLMIAQETAAGKYCNLSSWYMRPDMRKYAALLFQRSLRFADVTYTDCSPAPHVLPIVEKFGFRPYTGGTVLLDARQAWRSGPTARPLTDASLLRLDPALRDCVARHLSYGCKGFMLRAQQGDEMPVMYRTTRLKQLVPAARFVMGTPRDLIAQAGELSRRLLLRGIPVMMVDWPPGVEPARGGLLPGYGVRYVRGSTPPAPGDLSDTEIGIFGL